MMKIVANEWILNTVVKPYFFCFKQYFTVNFDRYESLYV